MKKDKLYSVDGMSTTDIEDIYMNNDDITIADIKKLINLKVGEITYIEIIPITRVQ